MWTIVDTTIIKGIAGNLASEVIFLALVTLVRRFPSSVSRTDPRRRKLRMLVIAVLWAAANMVYYFSGASFYVLFLLTVTLICGWVCYQELHQFWRIDLVGADAQMGDGITPENALRMCTTSLDFLGVGASKLTTSRAVFQEAISKCDRPGRSIRFLLSSPDFGELQRIARKAGKDQDTYKRTVQDSLRQIERLKHEEKNIEVRFYKDFPAFRLMFINDEVLLVSHYVLGKGDGLNMPQLHIVRTSSSLDTTSLYFAFQHYFEDIWKDAEIWNFQAYL